MSSLWSVLVAAATSLLVAGLTSYLAILRDRASQQQAEKREANLKYLNPLRFHLVENYLRLQKIREEVRASGVSRNLLFIDTPSKMISKNEAWFNGEGTYLASACYFTACLFASMLRIRRDLPYLRLSGADDTIMLAKSRKLSIAYRKHLGVFYTTQESIGQTMDRDGRVATYREFCGMLVDPAEAVWLDRLVEFYLSSGRGEHMDRLEDGLRAIEELLSVLDSAVGGGASLISAVRAESQPASTT
jgi:hypothetical protein